MLLVDDLLKDLLVGVPTTLTKQVLGKIVEEVNREGLMTEESIRGRLQQLLLLLQNGEISETEYDELEEKLIERLRVVRGK
jgi:hypothetical protein